MTPLKLTRDDANFYVLLGPVFGSRALEKETHDRFYDDPGKIWYLLPEEGVASILNGVIRNFWAADDRAAEMLIQALQQDAERLRGILPRIYEKPFRRLGFHTTGYRKNFIEVSL